MADLDNPTLNLPIRLPAFGLGLALAVNDISDVATPFDDPHVLGASVARVGAQMLASTDRRSLALDGDGLENFVQTLAVNDVCLGLWRARNAPRRPEPRRMSRVGNDAESWHTR